MEAENGLILLDRAGNILWANREAAELLDLSEEDLRSSTIGSSGPIGDAIVKIGTNPEAELEGYARFAGLPHQHVAVHWKLWVLPAEAGTTPCLLSLSPAGSGDTLRALPEHLPSALGSAEAGWFRSDIEGRVLEANAAAARIFGYQTADELVAADSGGPPNRYLHPEARKEIVRLMLRDGSVAGYETEMHTRAEPTVWVEIFARAVWNAEGSLAYFEGIFTDITERKRIDAALRWSQERFRRLAESTRVVPFEFDPATRGFTYLGPQAETLFGPGFQRGLTLEGWASMVHPEDVHEATRFIHSAEWAENGDLQAEFRILDVPERGDVWIRQIVHREPAAETSERVRGFLFEITESKRLEEERERSRTQLRELAARIQLVREEERTSVARDIHDELGQALTLMRLDLTWLSGRIAGLAEGEAVEPVREKIGAMEQAIQGTLQSMRRILASLRPPLLEELGLKEAVEFHLQSFAKRIAIRHEFQSTPIAPLPDMCATAIFRIFQEILTNVARHARASRVKVSLGQENDQLLLTVQDNGRGFTQEALDNSKSLGVLGMYERAWSIGGELEILSSPRTGTIVILRLPVAPKESAKSTREPETVHSQTRPA